MIHVLKGYRGRMTNEQFIPSGVYAENDDALFGLARYLVQNRHAEVVEADDTQSETKPALDELTLKALKDMALEMALNITGAKSKADFIVLIEAAAAEGGEANDEAN